MPRRAVRLGVLLGYFGIGAMAGAILNIKLRNLRGNEVGVQAGIFAMLIGLGLLGPTRTVPAAIAAHLPGGAGWVLTILKFNLSIQSATPRELTGWALAIYQTTAFGALAAGSAFWGTTADRIGVAHAMVPGAMFWLCGHAVGFRLLLPRAA